MRVGAIQSCYLPWRGYFDFIASVDVFVIYDDVQYSTGSWRNRNRLKTETGTKWMTVPVRVHGKPAIDEVEIVDGRKSWQNQHQELIESSLGQAPYFEVARDIWQQGMEVESRFLSPLNVSLLKSACQYLGVTTPLVSAREFHLEGNATSRLIDLLTKLGAKSYLSGPSAQDYLDESPFRERGIRLEYKSYDYSPYPQQWGEFVDGVSILDLIANTGPNAGQFLRSRTPDRVAVS